VGPARLETRSAWCLVGRLASGAAPASIVGPPVAPAVAITAGAGPTVLTITAEAPTITVATTTSITLRTPAVAVATTTSVRSGTPAIAARTTILAVVIPSATPSADQLGGDQRLLAAGTQNLQQLWLWSGVLRRKDGGDLDAVHELLDFHPKHIAY